MGQLTHSPAFHVGAGRLIKGETNRGTLARFLHSTLGGGTLQNVHVGGPGMTKLRPTGPIDLSRCFELREELTSIEHDVYTFGEGPPVILMHELTGMTPQFMALAARIASQGFRVYLPHFFGKVNNHDVPRGLFYCLRDEFNVWTSNGDSRIANWLRALCTRADAEGGGGGVGVIGLCFSGNIVMSAMVLDSVRLGVMSEPALPFFHKAALGVPEADLERAKARAQVFPMLAYRFSSDTKCTHERFQTLADTFGPGIRLKEIPTGVAPWHIPDRRHSVLTDDSIPNISDPDHPVQHVIEEILSELRLRLHRDR